MEEASSPGKMALSQTQTDETQGIVNEGIGIVSYNPHFKGAITLLRMREEEQFSSKHSTEMFDFVMQILVRAESV